MRAGLRAEMMLESIIDERRKLGVGLDDDIAAMAAVAAVGSALGTKASRRNDMQPAPPSPPLTLIRQISVNWDTAPPCMLTSPMCKRGRVQIAHPRRCARRAFAVNMQLAYQMPLCKMRCVVCTRPLFTHKEAPSGANRSEGLPKDANAKRVRTTPRRGTRSRGA